MSYRTRMLSKQVTDGNMGTCADQVLYSAWSLVQERAVLPVVVRQLSLAAKSLSGLAHKFRSHTLLSATLKQSLLQLPRKSPDGKERLLRGNTRSLGRGFFASRHVFFFLIFSPSFSSKSQRGITPHPCLLFFFFFSCWVPSAFGLSTVNFFSPPLLFSFIHLNAKCHYNTKQIIISP